MTRSAWAGRERRMDGVIYCGWPRRWRLQRAALGKRANPLERWPCGPVDWRERWQGGLTLRLRRCCAVVV